jgi:hypothetical protein
LQRSIHCIDLLGDGFLLRLQSFDVGQLFIDFTLALRLHEDQKAFWDEVIALTTSARVK